MNRLGPEGWPRCGRGFSSFFGGVGVYRRRQPSSPPLSSGLEPVSGGESALAERNLTGSLSKSIFRWERKIPSFSTGSAGLRLGSFWRCFRLVCVGSVSAPSSNNVLVVRC
jgi:hypothetical protein